MPPLTLVSVIVTTYNSAGSIDRTLASLFSQQGRGSAFELQVIVVDDCSTDTTRDIVASYPDVDLLVNPQNSGGPNRGRNRGLERASGQAICIVDHDDEWFPDRLICQLPGLKLAPIVSCGYDVVDEQSGQRQRRAKSSSEAGPWVSYETNQTFRARLARQPSGQTTYLGTLLFDARLASSLRFEEVYGAVDYDFILRLFEGQGSVEYAGSLYARYVFGTNLSLNEGYRLKDFAHSKDVLEQYRGRFPREAGQGVRRLHGSLARYYYLTDRMPLARRYFLRGEASAKTALYWLTTWAGAGWVRRRFNVFG